MSPTELRRRIEALEAKAPAEPIGDPELAAKFEAMSNDELDAWLESHLAEKAKDPEWVAEQEEFHRRLESLSDAELQDRLRWLCTDPKVRGEWKWP